MPPGLSARARAPLLALLLFAGTLAAFAPALSAGFLEWDDAANLLEHTRWRGLGGEELRWMFSTLHLGPYQPLAWLSLGVDWELWGLDPRGYHLSSVLLHAANAVLAFACVRALLRLACSDEGARAALDLAAAGAAALFAWHPLRVESVAWISERRDVLSGFFLLLSLRVWIAHVSAPRGWTRYGIACGLFAASLLAKASAMGWPLVLLVLDVWLFGRLATSARAPCPVARKRALGALVLEKLPLLLVSGVLALVAWRGQAALGEAMLGWREHGLAARLAQACYGWLFYPLQTLAVVGVRPFYDLELPLDPAAPRFVAAMVLCALLGVLAWRLRARAPAAFGALLAYTLLVLPVLGFAQTGAQIVAARYSYLPGLALSALAGAGVLALLRARPRGTTPAALVLAFAAGLLAARAHADARSWHDDVALWTRARELDPGSRVALRNLAGSLHAEARARTDPAERRRLLEQARGICEDGLRQGEDELLHNAHASVLAALADLEPRRAAELHERALAALRRGRVLAREGASDPGPLERNLGALLVHLGRAGEAVEPLESWCRREPGRAEAWAALGHAWTEFGRPEPALAALDRALELDRDLSGAWVDRGLLLVALRREPEAIRAFEEALEALGRRLGAGADAHPDATEARRQLERLAARPPR